MAVKKQAVPRPEIRKVDSPAGRERVYRFWYDTYVTEMRRPVKGPDHERGLLIDCLEDHSTILAAYADGEITGTVRLNTPSRGPIFYYESLYGLDRHEHDRARTAIVTKYMVHARYRATPLAYKLACAALVECVEQQIDLAFMDCNEHLLSYFSALGFDEHIAAAHHPEFGSVRIMKYDLKNPKHNEGVLGGFIKTSLHAAFESRAVMQPSD
jgi:hypothetical protein